MQKILDVNAIKFLVAKHGLKNIIKLTMDRIEYDFSRWKEFDIIPRPAFHVPGGVIELMPSADKEYFTYKYVNGHPINPKQNKLTVAATGQMSKTKDGYPIFITEMTILTAIRTAAVAALATKYMAKEDSKSMAIIGTGAQSEFQLEAHLLIRDLKEIHYFDTDPKAMDKFERNVIKKHPDLTFKRFDSVQDAIKGVDIVTVCTATKAQMQVIKTQWIEPGMHLNGLGGDCPGKTEFEKEILQLDNSRVVVEFFEQSFIEGEIQNFDKKIAKEIVYAQMSEICDKSKKGRDDDKQITIFDSVGIGLEDFSILYVIKELIKNEVIGDQRVMTPILDDVKDLFGLLESNINVDKIEELDTRGIKPLVIGNAIYDICAKKQQFKAITKDSCMCTVGVWSGAQKYYGTIGLIHIGDVINSSIGSLLGESDREERLLYGQLGKINGSNYVVAGIEFDQIKNEQKWIDRLDVLNRHGVTIHFKSQVDKLGYKEIINQTIKQFEAKGLMWGIILTNETIDLIKPYLKNKNFIGYEINTKENI